MVIPLYIKIEYLIRERVVAFDYISMRITSMQN